MPAAEILRKLADKLDQVENSYRPLNVLDTDLLPTLYAVEDNNTNDVIDNPNTGGLVTGRPWTE
jgi:hypothetical protein